MSLRLVAQRDEEQLEGRAEAEEALVPAHAQLPGLLQELGARRAEAGSAGAQQPLLGGAARRAGLQGHR